MIIRTYFLCKVYFTYIWQKLFQMSCCGVESASDYNFGAGQLPHNNELPGSCCNNGEICNKNSNDRYTTGCGKIVYEFTVTTNLYLGYVSSAVGIAEVSNFNNLCYYWYCQAVDIVATI